MQIFFVFFDGKPKNVVKPTPESHESRTSALVPESNPAFKEEREFRAEVTPISGWAPIKH